MTIRVLIIEDELPAREKLSHQLSLMSDIELVGCAEDGMQAISMVNELKPDVVTLDVDMPQLNGIDALAMFEHQPFVIFTTAYDKYALQAFENRALDYLLKPYSLARLQEAISRVRVKHQEKQTEIYAEKEHVNKLVSYIGERMYMLSPNDVCFFKAEQKTTMAFDQQKSWPMRETLDQLEAKLPAQQFVRIHRSYLVNVDHIQEMQRWFNGKLMLIIANEQHSEISTSRAGAERIKQLFK